MKSNRKSLIIGRMSFRGLSLKDETVRALEKAGFKDPSPVQKNVIPRALRGASLLAQSPTGTGKTHAFLVPIVDRVDCSLNRLQAVIVAPTRELARQIYHFARAFEPFFPGLNVRLYSGEASESANLEGAKKPPQIAIGTPGRLASILLDDSPFTLQNVKTLVLDEADMLLDLGFFPDVKRLAESLNDPQILVFSATLKPHLRDALSEFVGSSFEFEGGKEMTSSNVKHHLLDVRHLDPKEALRRFLAWRRPYLCLVFASKVEEAKDAHRYLKENGTEALYYSGELDDRERKRALKAIRENRFATIVGSDLLSRGIDIPDVTDVVSLSLPSDLSFYFHRAGRTGRFDKEGDSWVFYDHDSLKAVRRLLEEGTPFDYWVLSKDEIKPDPKGPFGKERTRPAKPLSEGERKEIAIAKAKARPKHVEPMYKKKRGFAVEKVKRKYRKKAIRESIRKNLRAKSGK